MAKTPIDTNSKSKTKSKGSPFLAALFKVLGTLIIVLILCISIPAAIPRLMGYELYNIVSGSMEPTIPVGAAVYVQKSDPSTLEVGNIIAFEVNGDVVVHRITQNDNAAAEIHTKGDANDAEDMWGVPYGNVLGRVRVSVRMLGSFLDFSTSSTGKLFVFVILFAGIMFSILGKLLTPPDEFEDYDEPKDTKKKLKVEEKPKAKEADSKDEIKSESFCKEDEDYKLAPKNDIKAEPKEETKFVPRKEARVEKAPIDKPEEKPRTLAESTGIKRTITVSDAVNNTVDKSIIDEGPSYEDAELDKPITLKDLAKRNAVSNASSTEAPAPAPASAPAATPVPAPEASAPAPVVKEVAKEVNNTVSASAPTGQKSVLLQLADEVEAERNKYGNSSDEDSLNPEVSKAKEPEVEFKEKSGKKKDKKADKKAKLKDKAKAEPKKEASTLSKGNKSNEDEKYKKMLSAIIVIIIILVVALLGVVGTIFFINYNYNKMDAVNEDVVSQFTSTPSEEVVEVVEEPEDDRFVLHTTQKCPIDVDFESLWEVNPDVVGWIYCEDTVINYPILQGEDDEYYLHHDINGKNSSAGCIFIDCNNMKDFTDVNSILYGHHMKNGSMFAGLQNWENQEYYDAHKYMWIITPDGNYEVWLFSGYLTDAFSDSYLGIRNWGDMAEEYITTAYNNSDFVSDLKLETMMMCEEDDQRHVMLSTCEYEFQNARYVLHGKLVKETPGIYGNDNLDASGAVIDKPEETEIIEIEDTSSDETDETSVDESEINFENLAEVKKVNNSVSNAPMGEYSVHRFEAERCTVDFLTKWYTDYINQHDNLLWNVIYYSDKDDNSGIYYSNKLLEKNVILDDNGMISSISDETQYILKNNQFEETFVP